MSLRVFLRPRAVRDLERHVEYLDENAGRNVGDRYLVAAGETFNRLADMPNIGVRREHRNPVLDGLRIVPVIDFKKYLIHYKVSDRAVEIVRILHTSQDADPILDSEDE